MRQWGDVLGITSKRPGRKQTEGSESQVALILRGMADTGKKKRA